MAKRRAVKTELPAKPGPTKNHKFGWCNTGHHKDCRTEYVDWVNTLNKCDCECHR